MARVLLSALHEAGIDARVASEIRTWSKYPDPEVLSDMNRQCRKERDRLVQAYQSGPTAWLPDLWFTYHNYYRAPDLLGPSVAHELGIPYVLAEASYASRRTETRWAPWLAAAATGIRSADAIFSFTDRDRLGLLDIVSDNHLHAIPPFIDLSEKQLTPRNRRPHPSSSSPLQLVTVAMMRPGAKQQSYHLLAESLRDLVDLEWRLDVVGDGEVRPAVEKAFRSQIADRVTWHGELTNSAVQKVLMQADVFVWPGIEEAFGMSYLEAQALGLPVVACRTAGVPAVVCHGAGGLLAETTKPAEISQLPRLVIENAEIRTKLADQARAYVAANHSIKAASSRLASVLAQLVATP